MTFGETIQSITRVKTLLFTVSSQQRVQRVTLFLNWPPWYGMSMSAQQKALKGRGSVQGGSQMHSSWEDKRHSISRAWNRLFLKTPWRFTEKVESVLNESFYQDVLYWNPGSRIPNSQNWFTTYSCMSHIRRWNQNESAGCPSFAVELSLMGRRRMFLIVWHGPPRNRIPWQEWHRSTSTHWSILEEKRTSCLWFGPSASKINS